MFRPTRVRIDTRALHNNLSRLKGWTGDGFFCPMVKANGYGHDEILVAREVEAFGADAAGVALVEEGMRLRQAGIQMPLLVFGVLDPSAARAALEFNLTPVVGRFEDFDAIAEAAPDIWRVHLIFNTGMQRLGFEAQDLPRLRQRLKELSFLKVGGVCTHLTHGEDAAEDGPTRRQIASFEQMAQGFTGVRHYHKTASLSVLQDKAQGQGSRPGIGIFGLPHEGRSAGPGLEPVLSWTTELIRVHTVEKGETVGYSGRWTAPRRTQIGVLPVGYGDGYMRALSNKGEALFRGQRVPVVGSVCMDYIFIDLTEALNEGAAQPGESVVLLGRQGSERIGAEDLAEKAGTISYEIVTAITRRVPREAV